MKNSYSILINTCDNFEDCWNPFFQLWSIYWKDCQGKIYLNTEYKDYYYRGLDIVTTQVCKKNNVQHDKRATWSQCLKWALEQIDTDIVLYMQEDYFLKDNVKNEIVEKYVQLMTDNENIKCIHLTDQAVFASGKSKFTHLSNVEYKQRYRVSCQAALWRKEELLILIRESEDAWQFEEFGSMRSSIMKHDYYVVDSNYVKLNQFEIIPYVFTGIIQGRWYEETIPLFEKHNILIDFGIRGFVKDGVSKPLIKRIKYRFVKIKKIIINRFDLYKLKKQIKKNNLFH